MKRSLILSLSLLMRVMALAQSTGPVYTVSSLATGSVPTVAAPHRTNAAESPVYVKVYGLYGLLTPGVRIDYSEVYSGGTSGFKTTNRGLGAGLRAGAGLGFIVSDFINLGIDADMLFGAELKNESSFTDGVGTVSNSATTSLKVISVIPNITFKALSRPGYYIYNRLGLVGGMVLDYKDVIIYNDINTAGVTNGTTLSIDNYTQNSLSLGYQAALGIQFRLSQRLRGFAEVVAYNQSFKPEKLESSRVSTKPTKITKEFLTTELTDQGSNVTATATQTGQQQTVRVPMNSVGVGISLSYRF